jgi:AraC family transcriptional regulator, exoenzyme S synthesis regulatory protein ExsA
MIIPDDLNHKGFNSESIVCMAYHTDKMSVKSRITFRCNTFSFLLQGEKAASYTGGSVKVMPGQFAFMPEGNFLMTERTADDGWYISTLLFVGSDLFKAFFDEYYPEVVADSTAGRLPAVMACDTFLQSFVQSLGCVTPDATALLKIKLQELLFYLCNKYDFLVPYFKSLNAGQADEEMLRKAVYAHKDNAVTMAELAFLCNMSLSTFKRKFLKTFGTTPKQWFQQQRMEKAAMLLKTEGCKASEIYDQLGFENLSSFIQSFKQFYGTTPKKFQE